MKKIILIIISVALFTSCGGDKRKGSFELKGTLENSKGETIYLEELSPNGIKAIDSTSLDDKGNFEFMNANPKIGFYRLKVNEQNFAMLVCDSTQKITLTGNIIDLGNTYKVEGSPDTKLFLQFNAIGKGIQAVADSLGREFNAILGNMQKDSLRMDSLSKVFEPIYTGTINKRVQVIADLILANLGSMACLAGIQQLQPEKFLDVYTKLDESLSEKYPGNTYILRFHQEVENLSRLAIGSQAPEITLPGPDGTLVSLSTFRGKIVMIDFWASWCKPCRKENPNVVRLYNLYHKKGFEVFGVSLDEEKDNWIDAIKTDGLTWIHVSDLAGWKSSVCPVYGISAIPLTVLLDKEGRIIDKGLRGPDLEKRLATLLN